MTDSSGSFTTYRAGMILLVCYIVLLTKVAPMPGAVWTMLAVFAAALVSGVVGFGFAALCGAMLVHLLGDPMRALEITLVCGIASQIMMVWSLRRDIDWHACPDFWSEWRSACLSAFMCCCMRLRGPPRRPWVRCWWSLP